MRTNLSMSEEMSQWYTEQAAKMGVSKNAMMTIGLKAYMDSQKVLETRQDVQKMMGQFQDIMQMAKEVGLPIEAGPKAMIEAVQEQAKATEKVVKEAQKRKKA